MDNKLKPEKYTTGTGQKLLVHNKETCGGESCVIHNPSNHHMKDWPTHWREDRGMMERICKCGIGHPDPDDLIHRIKQAKIAGVKDTNYLSIHGCCGCCNPNNDNYK